MDLNPLWVIAVVVVIVAIGTGAFWRGLHLLVGWALWAAIALCVTAGLLTGGIWIWKGGSHGWCISREEEARQIAAGIPPRTIDFEEFQTVLKGLRNASQEKIDTAARAAGRQKKGCWWSWKSTNGHGL